MFRISTQQIAPLWYNQAMNTRKTTIHLALTDKDRKVKIVPAQPVIFLAGPIRNAPDWQSEAIKFLLDKDVDAFVASPRRTAPDSLRPFIAKDNNQYEVFERQRAWEQYYLYKASDNGCIFFYLPAESKVKDDEEKVYAHITMMELGEWIARHKANPEVNLIVATDGDFPEWSTIKFELESESISAIYTSLQEGLEAVIQRLIK